MARRPISERQVTDVEMPQDGTSGALDTASDVAFKFADLQERKDIATINGLAANANLQLLKTTNEWRLANQSDPTNEGALKKLNEAHEKILNSYDDKVGFISKGTWSAVKNKLKSQYSISNLKWTQEQSAKNAFINFNDGITASLQTAAEYGRAFDIAGAKESFNTAETIQNGFYSKVFATAETAKHKANFKSDYMEMMMRGAIQSDPNKAEILLNQEGIQNDLGNDPKRIESLRNLIEKGKKVQQNEVIKAQTESERKVLYDYLQDENSVDLVRLDSELKANQISPNFALKMKNMLESPKSVNAKTDMKTWTNIRQMISNNEDQQKVWGELTDANAQGKLSRKDYQELVKFMDTRIGLPTISEKKGEKAKGEKTDVLSPELKIFNQAVGMIKIFADMYTIPTTAGEVMEKELITRMMKNDTPIEKAPNLATQIIKEYVKQKNPSIAMADEKGTLMMDGYGRKAMVFPDGAVKVIPNSQSLPIDEEEEEQAPPTEEYISKEE